MINPRRRRCVCSRMHTLTKNGLDPGSVTRAAAMPSVTPQRLELPIPVDISPSRRPYWFRVTQHPEFEQANLSRESQAFHFAV
jgi:hypothetical protein